MPKRRFQPEKKDGIGLLIKLLHGVAESTLHEINQFLYTVQDNWGKLIQVVKAIKNDFLQRKNLAFLYKLEKVTMELVAINKKIIRLAKEFEQKYLIE
ncbi:hypothetical protein EZS27_014035 [termite gut metagenome]|uniref:Uncharacterized protein n=1 Tax=termite gut metagenome TaxID=433724 RepID=A0A5J4RV83_9ZZZZ